VLLAAVIDVAHDEPVCVRMWLDCRDLRYDGSLEVGRDRLHRVHFEPGHGQPLSELSGLEIKLDPVSEPFDIHTHGRLLI
jgi:hypothetical protein